MKKEKKERCVLELPLKVEKWQADIIEKRFEIGRHLYNDLLHIVLKKMNHMKRTKEYRALNENIISAYKSKDNSKESLLEYRTLLTQKYKMYEAIGVSEWGLQDQMTKIQKVYRMHIGAHVGHKLSNRLWSAIEKVEFGSGRKIHYLKYGQLCSLENKKIGSNMNIKGDMFYWTNINIKIDLSNLTEYEQVMFSKPIRYLRIVKRWMKTRYKYYLQIALEGKPYSKNRSIRRGKVGIDLGTQTIAYVSDHKVGFEVLANKINVNRKQMALLQRKIDRSRRFSNPDNYNEDGTIVRGKRLHWIKSKRYCVLEGKLRELYRKNTAIRKQQHYELANKILSLGDHIYIEPMEFKQLQEKKKETLRDENGNYLKKKRFGKSIGNRAPAEFVQILRNKLKNSENGIISEVDKYNYRASQYDHTIQKYNKKKLSDRRIVLNNGDVVQRDLYAAFLLCCANDTLDSVNQNICETFYPMFKVMHDACIKELKASSSYKVSSMGI